MEEDLECIPYIDGVVHDAHSYTPQDHDEELQCPGVKFPSTGVGCDEHRAGEQYRLAMWINYSGVEVLHKTRVARSLEEAQEWLVEYQGYYHGVQWFIVHDVTQVCSTVIE